VEIGRRLACEADIGAILKEEAASVVTGAARCQNAPRLAAFMRAVLFASSITTKARR
jgi:hypothetical protein